MEMARRGLFPLGKGRLGRLLVRRLGQEMRVTLLLSVIFFIVASAASEAGQSFWEPLGVVPSLAPLPRPSVSREFITRLRVANSNVILEKTTMKEVQARLGGTVGHRGDASESLDWICFHGTDLSGRWVLWLESGEIHGDTVGAFELRRIPPSAILDDRCGVLPSPNSRVILPVALQLGAREAQIVQALGAPTVKRGDVLVYLHEHQETIRRQVFSASNVLAVFVRGGVVEAIEVWKTTVS